MLYIPSIFVWYDLFVCVIAFVVVVMFVVCECPPQMCSVVCACLLLGVCVVLFVLCSLGVVRLLVSFSFLCVFFCVF